MAKIGTQIIFKGKSSNFERDSFDTIESMVGYSDAYLDEGHISFCKETGKHYVYKAKSNISYDHILGYWRELSYSEHLDNTDTPDYIVDISDLNADEINELKNIFK